jgi:hypothetical protein
MGKPARSDWHASLANFPNPASTTMTSDGAWRCPLKLSNTPFRSLERPDVGITTEYGWDAGIKSRHYPEIVLFRKPQHV